MWLVCERVISGMYLLLQIEYIDGLRQKGRNSIENTEELCLFRIYFVENYVTHG